MKDMLLIMDSRQEGDNLAGDWVVDLSTEQRAIEIATRGSLASEPGVPTYQPIIVCPVASAPEI